jgi:hypothetical protein
MKTQFSGFRSPSGISKATATCKRIFVALQAASASHGIWKSLEDCSMVPAIIEGLCVGCDPNPDKVLANRWQSHARPPVKEAASGQPVTSLDFGAINCFQSPTQFDGECPHYGQALQPK